MLDAAEHLKDSVPCTACRYCCDGCPMGLNIPDLLHKYNQTRVGSGGSVKMQLDALPKEKWLGTCGACAAVCPQKIAIPQVLAPLRRSWRSSPTGRTCAKRMRKPNAGSGKHRRAEQDKRPMPVSAWDVLHRASNRCTSKAI